MKCVMLFSVLLSAGFALGEEREPIRVPLDTDIMSDLDGVGALVVLQALADRGEAKILATCVCVNNPWSPLCLNALNTYFGRPDLPLGVVKGPAHNRASKYAQSVAKEFPHALQSADDAPDAASLYRQVLAHQPDRSVVMASVGQLTNFRNEELMLRPPAGASQRIVDTQLGQVKVAAVQMLGYDKTDVRRPGFDPTEAVVRYTERAAKDDAQLVVFPEYLLGRISVPGPQTERISKAAAAGQIYVIVGCWEVFGDGSFANTAILFDRTGKIVGKYNKVHAAVDRFEGEPPWSKPPQGKDADWFIRNDPEWAMQRGQDLPVFDLDFGRIGILTCYDGWFPETCRILSLKGAEILVWINGRRGTVEDFLVKSAMFQNEVAMIATNQAYGGGTMVGQWPAQILTSCPNREETYITATINLSQVRQARKNSRNFQQRRPDVYGEIVKPVSAIHPPDR